MPRWNVRIVREGWTVRPGQRSGTLLTPYGVGYRFARNGNAWELPRDAVVTMAGIHPPEARARCAAALDRASVPDPDLPHLADIRPATLLRVLVAHGGVRPPIVGLPSPTTPVRGSMNGGFDEIWGGMTEDYDAPPSRYETLLALCQEFIDESHAVCRDPLVLMTILTAQLEVWRDQWIWQLPQAVTYALSAHPAWRRAALAWLSPHRKTWVRDYLKRNPQIKTLGRLAARTVPDVPIWLRR